jgi:hypothetical protein
MLTIAGRSGRLCDGISRRNVLQIGGLALGGLSLPQILAAQEQSGETNRHKGVIMIFLAGGPPHLDMVDLKPNAPVEIRGEFNPIETNVPGIQLCEHLPRLAGMMDKLAIIRTMVGANGQHEAFQCLTGHSSTERPSPSGGWPSLGSVVSRMQGSADASVPPFVGLSPKMGHMPWADNGSPGFLGTAHTPFTPNAEGREDLVLNGVSVERLHERRSLLGALDRFRRDADASGKMSGMDAFAEQAFGVMTSSRLVDALDVSKEDPALRARYGYGDPNNRHDGAPRLMEQFLVARRLIEAGVRCVTLGFNRWDWHDKGFEYGREEMPMLDQGVSALVQDIHDRGLDKDISVVVWGEFGRTPKVNDKGGRDHWPKVSFAMLAGGGMKTGQMIGETNRLGEEPISRPVHFQEVFATLYQNLGIDTSRLTLTDNAGRPTFLVDSSKYRPLPELVG